MFGKKDEKEFKDDFDKYSIKIEKVKEPCKFHKVKPQRHCVDCE